MALNEGYVTGGAGVLGLAGSIFGGIESSQGAQSKYQSEMQIANLQMQEDQQRRQAMEISARRQQLENVRKAQQFSAANLAAAVNQGAQFSSAGEAGRSAPGAAAAYSNLGISQNLQIGEQLFNINQQISEQKINEAKAESQIASGQGISSIFGAIGQQAGNIGKLATLLPIA